MTEITVRQRNQVTIPKAIAEAAGLVEGAVGDMAYANGVITITFPGHRPPIDIMQFAGSLAGVWGSTPEDIDRNIRETRDSFERDLI